jgi:hypothetical protein
MTISVSPAINLTDDNDVTLVMRWDVEACKKPLYQTAVTVLSSRRQGTPSLATLREWLNIIVDQPATDFFRRNSEQARAFKISVLGCTTKTAPTRRWTVNFVTDKMALLLKLNEQVVKEKKAREIAMGKQGKAGPQKKLLRTIRTLLKRYGKSCGVAEAPRKENAVAVLLQFFADSLDNNFVRDCQHRDRRSKEEVFQDAASRTAHKLYSSSHFAFLGGNSRCLCKKTSSKQPTFDTMTGTTRRVGVMRRTRPAENDAAVVVVE